MMFPLLLSLLVPHVQAYHVTFTSTVTGDSWTLTHFVSAKVVKKTRMYVYLSLEQPLQSGERLVAHWTPPVIDGPCRVYDDTLSSTNGLEYVAARFWNKASLGMFCKGKWTCELIVRRPGQEDRSLHETRVEAKRPHR